MLEFVIESTIEYIKGVFRTLPNIYDEALFCENS